TQHYVGTVALMLGLYALFSAGRAWREYHLPFLACATILIGAKVFGLPVLNEVGALPGLSITWIVKWAAPVAGFGLAILSAVAVQGLVCRPPQPRATILTLASTVAILMVSLIVDWDMARQVTSFQLAKSLGLACGLAIALAVVLILPWQRARLTLGVAS